MHSLNIVFKKSAFRNALEAVWSKISRIPHLVCKNDQKLLIWRLDLHAAVVINVGFKSLITSAEIMCLKNFCLKFSINPSRFSFGKAGLNIIFPHLIWIFDVFPAVLVQFMTKGRTFIHSEADFSIQSSANHWNLWCYSGHYPWTITFSSLTCFYHQFWAETPQMMPNT